MAKTYLSNGAVIASGTASSNYVQQIAAGEGTFDIAVQNGIRFFDGQGDEVGVLWDGVAPLEVVIPTLSDIVSNPVVLKGVVNSADDIPSSASNGDLLYIGTNGTYFNPSVVCEAGDMAIYYNAAWHVISGENQISISGGEVDASGNHTVSLGGTAVKVLTVEGKELSLAIDYADVKNKIAFATNASNTLNVNNGTVTVSPMYIALSQAAGSTEDISTTVSISLPTALANGAVTIDSVLQANDFTFTSGAFPTISLNGEAIAVNASHNMSIGKDTEEGDFVTAVTAIKGVTFAEGSAVENDFGFVSSLSAISGTSFVSGVHAYTNADEGKTADFSIWGQATVSNSTFVKSLSEVSTSGDLVSSISVGTVSLDAEGTGILTGTNTTGSDFVTSVDFGTITTDTSSQWFFSGLTTGSDVVTDVTVGAVSFVSGNADFAGSAIVSASVSNHVLSFSTGSFMTPVSLSKASDTITKQGFSKAGVKLTDTNVSFGGFTSASLVQAATSVSFRSLTTEDVTLSQSSTAYFFDKAEDHNYDVVMGYVKHSVTAADVTKNAIKINNPTISVNIPAESVAVGLNAGTLPTFTVGEATGTITGTVGTELTMSTASWLGVNESKKDIAVAGAYTLVSDSSVNGAIEVAAAGTYDLNSATVTIAEGTYVTDVLVDGSSVGEYVAPVEPEEQTTP